MYLFQQINRCTGWAEKQFFTLLLKISIFLSATVSQFTDREINEYLVYMRTEYVPRRFGSSTRAFSKICVYIRVRADSMEIHKRPARVHLHW